MLSPGTHSAAEVIRLLKLEPLPLEGGYFRRVFASRPTFSSILFLLTPESWSALHRLKSDEIWIFQAGDPAELLRLHPDGSGDWTRLGPGVERGEALQAWVPRNTWQGARLVAGSRWALVSCLVVPEFVQEDFEPGDGLSLMSAYPQFSGAIGSLTREGGRRQ